MDKQLDVRSLIMTQNLLQTMIKLFVKPKTKRYLMRIQRRHKVLETVKEGNSRDMLEKSWSSSDEKDDLAVSAGSEFKILK